MTPDERPRGLDLPPNEFERFDLAASFGEVATRLIEALPARAAAIRARRVHITRELERVRRRLAELRAGRV